ncbi:MAG: phage protein Gp36 family protein [Bacteroidota bacterium]|nr:phage protein Gp36 family protein [Bacteroidota bacterium]
MSYADIERIEKRFLTRVDLDRLLDDEGLGAANPAIPQRETEIMQAVDEEINAQLQGLYPVPFEAGSVPPLIEHIADRLVAVAIYSRRPGELPPTIRDLAAWAETKMRAVIRREIQLLATDPPTKSQPPLVSKDDDDRIFSDTTLGKMPS